MTLRFGILALLLTAASAQAPQWVHAKVESQPASADLAAQIQTWARSLPGPASTGWIGYTQPAVPGGGDSSACQLEDDNGEHRSAAPLRLEGATSFQVLLRSSGGVIGKIRAFDCDCPLDAGDLPVLWLTGVSPAQSLTLLHSLIERGTAAEGALAAMARTNDDAAVDALIGLAKSDPGTHIRGQALFWLGQRATTKATAALEAAVSDDPDTQVKEQAVFGISQLPKDQGVPLLIQLAQTNKNVAVRKRAMFWLGQSQDPRALAFFAQVLGHR